MVPTIMHWALRLGKQLCGGWFSDPRRRALPFTSPVHNRLPSRGLALTRITVELLAIRGEHVNWCASIRSDFKLVFFCFGVMRVNLEQTRAVLHVRNAYSPPLWRRGC